MKLLFYGIVLLFCTSCSTEQSPIGRAMYHWQTKLEIPATAQAYLDSLSIQRLYVKFFDLDWNASRNEVIPLASLITRNLPQGVDIIPCIFITNRSIQQLPSNDTDELATRILEKIRAIMPNLEWQEIQIDCDWSNGTRDRYFALLEAIKQQLPAYTQLSITLRLHQYRYPDKTGIPPADRAMLMFYNMGDLQDSTEYNSILNLEKAIPYLASTNYALPLDFALPCFSWGVLFRQGKMIKLLNNINSSDLEGVRCKPLLNHKGNWYEVTADTYLEGYYLYEGDRIRLEIIEEDTLLKAVELLSSIERDNDSFLSFYHLISLVDARFAKENLDSCFRQLR